MYLFLIFIIVEFTDVVKTEVNMAATKIAKIIHAAATTIIRMAEAAAEDIIKVTITNKARDILVSIVVLLVMEI